MPNMELGNFVCRFGPAKVLVDYYDEIVLPAITSNLPRKWHGNNFVLYKVREEYLPVNESGKKTKVIYGRLVKNLTLTRKQLMVNGELIPKKSKMPTSPSSFFILYVDTHKLFFIPEMPFAPSISDFEYCVEWQLKRMHKEFIRELRSGEVKAEKSGRKFRGVQIEEARTMAELMEEHPRPSLTITSMATGKSFAEFIESFDKLKYITIDLLPVNEEVDPDAFFDALRKNKEKLGSKITRIEHRNVESGLNIGEAITTLQHIGMAGNHKIVTRGEDKEGNKLEGDNNDYKFKHPMRELPQSAPEASMLIHGEILQLIDSKMIEPVFL